MVEHAPQILASENKATMLGIMLHILSVWVRGEKNGVRHVQQSTEWKCLSTYSEKYVSSYTYSQDPIRFSGVSVVNAEY